MMVCFSLSLMKMVLHFMHNPKLVHILFTFLSLKMILPKTKVSLYQSDGNRDPYAHSEWSVGGRELCISERGKRVSG